MNILINNKNMEYKMKNTKRWLMLFIAATSLASCSLSFGMDIWGAIRENNIGRVAELVTQEGFDSNQTNKDGWTPLFLACYNNYPEIVRLLLDNGADVNKADSYGNSPLNAACYRNYPEIVRLLLNNGADINKADSVGRTPLHAACYSNNPEIVRLLLNNGADINKADNDGLTTLYYVCKRNYPEIVRLLLNNGANIDQRSLGIVRYNLPYPTGQVLAQRIQAMLNLTQRFDKWAKTGEKFDLTDQEGLEDGLREFTGRLLQSKRKEIIEKSVPKKNTAKTLDGDRYRRLDDCNIICEQEKYINN